MIVNKIGIILLVVAILSTPALGQEESDAKNEEETQSGYDELPEFGGPEGVSQTLKRNDEKHESTFQFDGLQHSQPRSKRSNGCSMFQ
jgi:uncharacterized protein YdeI (BOF family)